MGSVDDCLVVLVGCGEGSGCDGGEDGCGKHAATGTPDWVDENGGMAVVVGRADNGVGDVGRGSDTGFTSSSGW